MFKILSCYFVCPKVCVYIHVMQLTLMLVSIILQSPSNKYCRLHNEINPPLFINVEFDPRCTILKTRPRDLLHFNLNLIFEHKSYFRCIWVNIASKLGFVWMCCMKGWKRISKYNVWLQNYWYHKAIIFTKIACYLCS